MSKPTIVQFIAEVRLMRKLQKEYFKTRDYSILFQAREAEKDVDRTLAALDKAESSSMPPTLLKLSFPD